MRFLACVPTLADILFLALAIASYMPPVNISCSQETLLHEHTQGQASKRSICATFCNSGTILSKQLVMVDSEVNQVVYTFWLLDVYSGVSRI